MDSKKLEDLIDKQGLYKLNSIMFDALGHDNKCKNKVAYLGELKLNTGSYIGYQQYGCDICEGYNSLCRCYIK